MIDPWVLLWIFCAVVWIGLIIMLARATFKTARSIWWRQIGIFVYVLWVTIFFGGFLLIYFAWSTVCTYPAPFERCW